VWARAERACTDNSHGAPHLGIHQEPIPIALVGAAGGEDFNSDDAKLPKLNFLAAILVRIADAIESFDFLFIQCRPSLFLLEEIHEGLRQQPNLFEEMAERAIKVV
jgi:hypothetical protein